MQVEILMRPFSLIRENTFKAMSSVTEENADIMLPGYNNNLRWNVGHILVVAERLCLQFAGEPSALPEEYTKLFALGTKPADWDITPPSIETLKAQLKEQLPRIQQRLENRLNDKLTNPFKAGTPFEMDTVVQTVMYSMYHEGDHTSAIKGILKGIQNR